MTVAVPVTARRIRLQHRQGFGAIASIEVAGEEPAQRTSRVVRVLLREEVTPVHGPARDSRSQASPDLQRASVTGIPRCQWPHVAPQRKRWTVDPASQDPVGTIMGAVDAGRGAVLLTDRV